MIVYRELSSLSHDLGFSAHALYSASNRLRAHYHAQEIPKKDGGTRTLFVPDAFLKAVQRSIAEKLLSYEPVSPYATAYRFGASPVMNARPHVGKERILKLDIRKFFDSVTYAQIKESAFPAERYSEQNRILLALLCTYKNALPQGAPTSPAISNLIMRDFDNDVGEYCLKLGISYTRYCDDMTFSGSFEAADLREFVRARLRKMGFYLNGDKTVSAVQGQRMTVTGITVNSALSVSKDYRRKLRQELYYCRKFGVSEHLRHEKIALDERSYCRRLLGRVSFVLSVSPEDREMRDYAEWLKIQLKK